MKRQITLELIQRGIENSSSMKQASDKIGIPYNTFIRYAKKFGLYSPNQGLKGAKRKKQSSLKKPIGEYLKADVNLNATTLKIRLFKEGFLKEECSECKVGSEWNGKKLNLQLDHKDGNRRNNLLSNLRALCPNCHSQTDTFCRGQGKNYAGVV